MAHISLYVLDGADRGRRYENLVTPITIGREEGNAVQLNDERISRFHIKIQEDQDMLVLTDLDSTNGTRVNGEQVQLRILRFGDIISLGRSVLRYGTREQIAQRLKELRAAGDVPSEELDISPLAKQLEVGNDSDADWTGATQSRSTLHIPKPPDLPEGLGPGQAAQLSELLEYLHLRSRALIEGIDIPEESSVVKIDIARWQEILDAQGLLADYLRRIGDPDRP
ncbi:FHA domain-containing protein [Aeoliella sp. ICT_H6.2]|uniref:FHA domain-containing protein n=1 Tax=Aeoliella straminimaris TaxID=2954799 RepID=A0A9X2F692_9BACT|nr:FHA domain-containing protein [Aeoliella straminimaris]MCO6043022.1 FHA domain-containing protein [Aeoliella straminimaris]